MIQFHDLQFTKYFNYFLMFHIMINAFLSDMEHQKPALCAFYTFVVKQNVKQINSVVNHFVVETELVMINFYRNFKPK